MEKIKHAVDGHKSGMKKCEWFYSKGKNKLAKLNFLYKTPNFKNP